MADMLLRDAAMAEVKQLMGAMRPEGLTGVELLALLAILRSAKERLDAQQRPPAPAQLSFVRDRRNGETRST